MPFCFALTSLWHILFFKGDKMRKKIKGKLYFLAKDAKSRMRNYNKEKSIFEQMPYVKSLSAQEQDLYERVKKLLNRDEVVINPIQELIDRKYYNSLNNDAKQKYIFDLSEKYKELKTKFEREETTKVSNF